MNSRFPRLLVVTDETHTVSAVASALGENGRFAQDCVCGNLEQLVTRMEADPPPAVLVDIDPRPSRMLNDLEAIVARFCGTRFIVLTKERHAELLLEAMQIGARHVLAKAAIPVDLAGVLRRLIPDGTAQASDHGAVFTVFSASGGCGATTLAVNLAHELHQSDSQAALIVDLDASYGAVASYLGLNGEYGLADVLADPSRIDVELIRSTALSYSTGLKALISPASSLTGTPGWLDGRQISVMLRSCQRAFRHTVVDAPRVPMETALQLAGASDTVLVVFQLTVKDVRHLQLLIHGLTRRGVPSSRIVPVVNRYRKRHAMLTLEEAEAAIEKLPCTRIRNDFKAAIRGMNYGQVLAQAAPRSGLRKDVRALATRLSGVYLSRTTAASGR